MNVRLGYQANAWGGVVGHPVGVTSIKDLFYLTPGDTVDTLARIAGAGYAGVAGLLTGVITSIITAPIAAYLFDGGSGIDALVAAFYNINQRSLAIISGEHTVVEPFDKLTLFLIVYLIVQLLPQRLRQRFPNTRAAADGDIGR